MKKILSYIVICVLTFTLSSCITPDVGESVTFGYGYNIYYDNPVIWHRHPGYLPPKRVDVPGPPRPTYVPREPKPRFDNHRFSQSRQGYPRQNRSYGNMRRK